MQSKTHSKLNQQFNDQCEFVPLPRVCFNITVRNSQKWIEECLQSVMNQDDKNWRCIVTDDVSTDDTWKKIEFYEKESRGQIEGRQSDKRCWKAKNFHTAVAAFDPHDVIVELDGDDQLAHKSVVYEIRRLHQTYDLIWTQHSINQEQYPDWHFWPSTVIPDNWTRSFPVRSAVWTKAFHPGHLRTFKRFLYDQIDIEDLQFEDGWLKCSFDTAYYTALIEMTIPRLRYFYDRICAIYTILPHNDTFIDMQHGSYLRSLSQSAVADYVRNRPAYKRLLRRHIAVVLPKSNHLLAHAEHFNMLINNHPDLILYIGVLADWDSSLYNNFRGIRFINLEHILRTGAFKLNKPAMISDELALAAMGLYLLKNSWADSLIVHPLDSFLLYISERDLKKLICPLVDRIPYQVCISDIPILKQLIQTEECAGSPV